MTNNTRNIIYGILLIIFGALFVIPLFKVLATVVSIGVIIWGIWLIVQGVNTKK